MSIPAVFICQHGVTIPVNNVGQPVNERRDSVFILFVETRESRLQWNKAWRCGTSFSVNATQINGTKTVAGQTTPGDKKIVLAAAKGNTLWQLELTGSPDNEKAPQPTTHYEVLLKGKRKNQIIYHKMNSLTEVASPLYQ